MPVGSSSLQLFFDLGYAGDYKWGVSLITYRTVYPMALTWWKKLETADATAAVCHCVMPVCNVDTGSTHMSVIVITA